MEKDDELKGEGNSISFAERSYDPRIGRWWSPDAFETVLASHSPYSFALNNPIYLVDEHGDYPKPSQILANMGVKLPPLAAGLVDGLFEGSPLGLIGFAADLTDPKFRSDMIDGFKAIANDPIGALGAMFSEYKDVIERTLSGNATAEDEYLIGNEIGSTVSGALTGGGIVKILDKVDGIKDIAKSKLVKKVLKEADDVEIPSKAKGIPKAKKSHGNTLDDKAAEGYTLRDKKTGEIKKYGETTRGEDKFGDGKQKRYTKKYLKEEGLHYVKEKSGTKKEMHSWQHEKILEHKKNHSEGARPKLNKSDY